MQYRRDHWSPSQDPTWDEMQRDAMPTIEFFVTRQVKAARKPHRCNTCRRTIQPGEPYQRIVFKDDVDGFQSFADHGGCWMSIE